LIDLNNDEKEEEEAEGVSMAKNGDHEIGFMAGECLDKHKYGCHC